MPREMDQRLAAAAEKNPSWQEMYRELRDFQKLSNAKSLPPRLVKWMDAQRRRYKLYGVGRKKSVGIIKHRIAQLDSVGFDWHHGEEKRVDHDPSPTVILPLSQSSPTRPSRHTHTQRINEPLQEEEYSSQPIRRSKKKPQSRSSTGGNEPMDRKELLNAGFPEQLFHMVNGASERASHLLDWTPDGSAFEIYDTKNIGNFIRQYFRHSNLSSLRRMLHYYSFSTANNVYRHPHFYRGNSLSNIKRRVVQKHDERNSTEEVTPVRRKKGKKTRRDSGADEEVSSPHKDKKQLLNAGFPEQLFHMVNGASERASHKMNWTPDGSAFEIYDTKNVGSFIRQYFRHSNLSSLRRMLHLYSFSTANNVYRHPHFHRDSSLADIKRNLVKKT